MNLGWKSPELIIKVMAPVDWHRRFSARSPEICEFATAMCEGHSASGVIERVHKPYGLVHSRQLRSGLTKPNLVSLVHLLHHNLRLKV